MSDQDTNAPWRNEELLRQKYWGEEKSTREIASEWGTSKTTILRWLDNHGIGSRTAKRDKIGPWKDRDACYKRYVEEGMTCEEMAQMWGCETRTVSEWLNKHGINTRTTSDYQSGRWRDKETLKELYVDKGLSSYEVGQKLGCGSSTILEWLERHGIDRDDPGWPNKEHPWQDEDTLRELYWDEGLNQREIAEHFGTHPNTIQEWFSKFGIETRLRLPGVTTREDGYESIQSQYHGKTERVRVHRLAAIAWGKLDPSDLCNRDIDIHHKTNIPWDNREDVLEALPHGEHRSLHGTGEIDIESV